MNRPAPAAVPIHYPSSDGKPMAENDAQRDAIMYGISALTRHFKRPASISAVTTRKPKAASRRQRAA